MAPSPALFDATSRPTHLSARLCNRAQAVTSGRQQAGAAFHLLQHTNHNFHDVIRKRGDTSGAMIAIVAVVVTVAATTTTLSTTTPISTITITTTITISITITITITITIATIATTTAARVWHSLSSVAPRRQACESLHAAGKQRGFQA